MKTFDELENECLELSNRIKILELGSDYLREALGRKISERDKWKNLCLKLATMEFQAYQPKDIVEIIKSLE